MKMNAYVAGVGMTQFGKHLERGLKSLAGEAIHAALADAGVEGSALQAAYMANASAGLLTGQEMIRGQVVLHAAGLGRMPVVNVENACASASTAFNQAAAMVSCGAYDMVLACGFEKMYHLDKRVTYRALGAAVDVEARAEILARLEAEAAASGASAAQGGAGEKRSMFMDFYASSAREHMQAYGTTAEQFAGVSAKNSLHGSLNARAQFREVMSVEQVMAAPMIAEPLTRPMCSPVGDGAAAVIVVSERKARALGLLSTGSKRGVRVRSSVLRSTWPKAPGDPGLTDLCIEEAYAESACVPSDLDVIELHDASAPAELSLYERLGLCAPGEGGRLIADGATRLGGAIPVNTSGGLLRKGHPIGATGIAQIVELVEQLEGRAGARQVAGARVALAQNGGGSVGGEAAAQCVTVLSK
jgi:acetyl-CoA acetyltransferase